MKIKTVFCFGLFFTASLAVKAQELLAPSNVTVVGASPQQLFVQFTDTNASEEYYIVYHSGFSASGPFEEHWEFSASSDVGDTLGFIIDGGYAPLTTVYIKVVAIDIDENTGDILAYGPPSEIISAVTTEFYQPQPINFKATGQGSHIRLTWTDTTAAGSPGDEVRFRIFRAEDGGSNYNKTFTLPANTTSYKDTDVMPNVVYTYRLDAEDKYGLNGLYLVNFASASLKHPQTLVYPNPTMLGPVTVNLDNQYNKGIVKIEIIQPVIGVYYTTTVCLHGSKFTLDAFNTLPEGNAYHLILTLPDGSVVTTMVFHRTN